MQVPVLKNSVVAVRLPFFPGECLCLIFALCLGLFAPAATAQERVIPNNAVVTNIFDFKGGGRLYRLDLPFNTKQLRIETYGGTGNADLFVRFGAPPSGLAYDFFSINPGNNENVFVTAPQAGSWYFLLYAFTNYSDVTLTAIYSGSTADAQTGQIAWAFDMGTDCFSSPSVGKDGTIYVTGKSGRLEPSLYAINPDGTYKDVMRFPFELYSSPVIAKDGTIYQTGEDPWNNNMGRLVAIAPFKTIKWEFPNPVSSRHPAAVAPDGTLYIPSDRNSLLAITPAGQLKWEFFAATQTRAVAPAIVGENGTVYCSFYNSSLSKGVIYALNSLGTNLWQFETPGAARSLALDGSGVVFGIADGTTAVYAIGLAGDFRWKADLNHQAYVISPPVVGQDGTIHVSTSRRLVALRSTGAERWHHDSDEQLFETEYPNAPVIGANGVVYYGTSGSSGSGSVYAISSTGQQLWRTPVSSRVRGPLMLAPTGNLLIPAPDRDGFLVAVKTPSPLGTSIWPASRQNLGNTGALPGPPLGSLQVSLAPPLAVAAGAQWQVDAGVFNNSGAIVSNLLAGNHNVSFKTIPGWKTPANLTVTIAEDQTTVATIEYLVPTGSLKVDITPPQAVTAGAQWQLDGGTFQASGTTLDDIVPGPHLLSFKPVDGWVVPNSQTVTINPEQVAMATGNYLQSTGAVTVLLGPELAVQAGAQWRVVNGSYQNSGAMLSGLPIGPQVIEFKPIPGWLTPAPRTVTINLHQNIAIAANYGEYPKMTAVILPNKQIVARFPTVFGYEYVLQNATTLTPPIPWNDLQTVIGTGQVAEVTLRPPTSTITPFRTSPVVFYRLIVR